LKVADGNKSKAAELLNIKRSTLGDRITRCGITETHEPGEAIQATA
jgi:DNA-binding protein Fis